MQCWHINVSQPQGQPVILKPLCNRPSCTNSLAFPFSFKTKYHPVRLVIRPDIQWYMTIKVVGSPLKEHIRRIAIIAHIVNSRLPLITNRKFFQWLKVTLSVGNGAAEKG